MADYGIKVSMDGYDIATANDRQLTLKTGYTLLKVFASGTISLSSGWNEVTHSLGYVPQYLVFVTVAGQTTFATGGGGGFEASAMARADTSKIYINYLGSGSTAFYYIFHEST